MLASTSWLSLLTRPMIVVGVSAWSSLAVDLARQAEVTLVGFAPRADFVVYARGDRIVTD